MNVLLCPMSEPGYLYPALAIGRELTGRGHRVTVLTRSVAEPVVLAAGLIPLAVEPAADQGFRVGRWFSDGHRQYEAVLRAAATLRPDVVLTSILGLGALLAAQTLDRPAVVIGFATHIWAYDGTPDDGTADEGAPAPGLDGAPAGELRRWRTEVTLQHYHRLRRRLGLPAPGPGLTPLLGAGLLLRGDPALEVPGAQLPVGVRIVGPCAWEPPADPGDVEALSEPGPFVYAHLGRDFGGDVLWPRLNSAFTGTGLRGVVEQGRSGPPDPGPGARVTIVRRPWLTPLVDRADVVLCSGTTSPVLAALAAARPLVLAPSGSEQPVLTAACVRAGVAVQLPTHPGPPIAATLIAAAEDQTMAARARTLAADLTDHPGAPGAADVVEAAAGSTSAAAALTRHSAAR